MNIQKQSFDKILIRVFFLHINKNIYKYINVYFFYFPFIIFVLKYTRYVNMKPEIFIENTRLLQNDKKYFIRSIAHR